MTPDLGSGFRLAASNPRDIEISEAGAHCRHKMEEEGARWPHWSSKPAWRLIQSPEGSTPSPLRQHHLALRFAGISGRGYIQAAVICERADKND